MTGRAQARLGHAQRCAAPMGSTRRQGGCHDLQLGKRGTPAHQRPTRHGQAHDLKPASWRKRDHNGPCHIRSADLLPRKLPVALRQGLAELLADQHLGLRSQNQQAPVLGSGPTDETPWFVCSTRLAGQAAHPDRPEPASAEPDQSHCLWRGNRTHNVLTGAAHPDQRP